nr:ATP-dependent DNA helicase RecQ [Bifidobacterium callimiconis]
MSSSVPSPTPTNPIRDFTPFALKALERNFGYTSFRTGQADVVNAIMNHRDVLAVLPTGAGKSVCYQLPAIALRLTLVITPLRALMRDQVQSLAKRHIAAALIDSGTAGPERQRIYAAALAGHIKLLYVAPERLHTNDFAAFAHRAPIDLIAVDEAHCVLQWGQDFRPAYLGIRAFVESLSAHLPARPVIAAFTATATPATRNEIIANLGQIDPIRVTTTFDRPNIRFDVRFVKRWSRERAIVDWAVAHKGQCGIVYCNSRARTEELEQALLDAGVAAAHFHARMPESDKGPVQDRFLRGEIQVICATSAFGMGVDKPDVRWVINDGATDSLEEYYQEAGRAGRDGKESVSLLLWADDDFDWLRKRVDESFGNAAMDDEEQKRAKEAALGRLDAMERYCETPGCLRAELLRYFGEGVGESAGERTAANPGGSGAAPASGSGADSTSRGSFYRCGACSHCLGLYKTSKFGSFDDDDEYGGGGRGGRGRGGYGRGRGGRDFDGTRYEDLDDDFDSSCSDGWGSAGDSQDSRSRYGRGKGRKGYGRGRKGGSYGGYRSYGSGRGNYARDDDDFDASQTSGISGRNLRKSSGSVYSAMFGTDSDLDA